MSKAQQLTSCKHKMWRGFGFNPGQCQNRAKKDGWCMVHHPDAVKARGEKNYQKYQDKWKHKCQVREEQNEQFREEGRRQVQATLKPWLVHCTPEVMDDEGECRTYRDGPGTCDCGLEDALNKEYGDG